LRELPAGIYFVVYGRIKLISGHARTGERLTGVIGPGRSLGEPVMILGRPYLVDAIAAEDALVLKLSTAAVQAEIEQNPAFAHAMLVLVSQRWRHSWLLHDLARDGLIRVQGRQVVIPDVRKLAAGARGWPPPSIPPNS
jgi:hypothetical protein